MIRLYHFAFTVTLFLQTIIVSSQPNYISLKQETQSLTKGIKNTYRYQIYYDREKEIITKYHTYPNRFITISNQLGETKIYFPDQNKVSIQQNQAYSISNELIFYFINNQISDLGLVKEGFKLINSINNEELIETLWQAPQSLKIISQVKVVYKDMAPIYAEYQRTNGSISKKIYYSRYQDFNYFRLPMRITEISYESELDSTIRLSEFSDVKVTRTADDPLFNYKIPDNAQLSE